MVPASHRRTALRLTLALALLACLPGEGASQATTWDPRGGLPAGSEEERYLRVLQLLGAAPVYPWSVRGFSPAEVLGLLPKEGSVHPWMAMQAFSADTRADDSWGWILPRAQLVANSGFPYGENDGALWAGRGLTASLEGGVWARRGRFHLRVEPQAFWAQNAAFDMAVNGQPGDGAFWDPMYTPLLGIDRPQRFGDGALTRVDPGATTLSADLGAVVLGAGSAVQIWGPATKYPLLLGDNAGGFFHGFVQTGRPLGIGFADVVARMEVGRLDQSDQSPVQDGELRRFTSSFNVAVLPRGIPGLEVGVARLSEQVWPEDGIGVGDLLRPFASATSTDTLVNINLENQLASAYFRWVFPAVGFEFFGELLKDDFRRDARHYITEPDDVMALTLGMTKAWRMAQNRLFLVRVESVSAEVHHSERQDRFREGALEPRALPFYQHLFMRQGHTQRGQLLGSPAAYGGAGWTLGADVYHPGGRLSVDLSRNVRMDWLPDQGPQGAGFTAVVYTVRGEGVVYRSGREWRAVVAPSLELNRNMIRGNDALNLSLAFSVRGGRR